MISSPAPNRAIRPPAGCLGRFASYWPSRGPLSVSAGTEVKKFEPPARLLSGPERIESGWWDGGDATRDYYVAGTEDGARLWVFQDLAEGGWYLQGLWT